MASENWDLGPQEENLLGLLEFLYDNDGSRLPNDLRDLSEPRRDKASLVRAGEEMGLLTAYRTNMRLSDTYPPVMLNGQGVERVESARRSRASRADRNRACRNTVVRWLYEMQDEEIAGSDRFYEWESAPKFFGEPFSQRDVDEALDYLMARWLVDGSKTFGPVIVRPRLSHGGIECAEEFDCDVRHYLRGSVPETRGASAPSGSVDPRPTNQYTFNIQEFSGQGVFGPDGTLTQSQGIDAPLLAEIFQAMRDALGDLSSDVDMHQVALAIDDLQAAIANPKPDVAAVERRAGILKRLAGRSADAAVTAAGTDGGRRIVALATKLVEQFAS